MAVSYSRNDAVRPTGVKAGDHMSFFIRANWKLCLIPVTERLIVCCTCLFSIRSNCNFYGIAAFHADDWTPWGSPLKASLAHHRSVRGCSHTFPVFEGQLGRVAHGLDLAAATLAGHRACRWLYSRVRGGCQHLHVDRAIAVVLFHFHDLALRTRSPMTASLIKKVIAIKFCRCPVPFFAEIFYGNCRSDHRFLQNSVVSPHVGCLHKRLSAQPLVGSSGARQNLAEGLHPRVRVASAKFRASCLCESRFLRGTVFQLAVMSHDAVLELAGQTVSGNPGIRLNAPEPTSSTPITIWPRQLAVVGVIVCRKRRTSSLVFPIS